MKLETIATTEIFSLNDSDPLDTAIQEMSRLNIRHLPVTREHHAVGMVSERDVLLHVCWLDLWEDTPSTGHSGRLLGATRVDQLMTSPVITLAPDDPVEEAARIMLNKKVGAVLLSNDEGICGIVTDTDLLNCFNDDRPSAPTLHCRQNNIVDHMSANVFAVAPEDATQTAFRLMRDKQLRHVPVVSAGELVGIVSDRDVLRGTARDEDLQPNSAAQLRRKRQLQVHGIMTSHVEVLGLSATVANAAQLMVTHKISAVPIIDQRRLVGIITETDLLRVFASR